MTLSNTIKKITAFTLAEVLITLTVIGVIAALTIPALVNKTQDMEYKVAWKKTFATYSNAFKKMTFDNGGELGNWDFVRYHIESYVVSHEPISATACNGDYDYMRNGGSCYFGSLITNDGVRMLLNNYGPYGSDLTFDVNGDKPPNRAGHDIFGASYTKEGKLIPFGSDGSTVDSSTTCAPLEKNDANWGHKMQGLACSAKYLIE